MRVNLQSIRKNVFSSKNKQIKLIMESGNLYDVLSASLNELIFHLHTLR